MERNSEVTGGDRSTQDSCSGFVKRPFRLRKVRQGSIEVLVDGPRLYRVMGLQRKVEVHRRAYDDAWNVWFYDIFSGWTVYKVLPPFTVINATNMEMVL